MLKKTMQSGLRTGLLGAAATLAIALTGAATQAQAQIHIATAGPITGEYAAFGDQFGGCAHQLFTLGFGTPDGAGTAARALAADGYRPDHAGTQVQVRSAQGSAAVTAVLRALDGRAPDPVSVAVHEPTLDDVFLSLTSGGEAA